LSKTISHWSFILFQPNLARQSTIFVFVQQVWRWSVSFEQTNRWLYLLCIKMFAIVVWIISWIIYMCQKDKCRFYTFFSFSKNSVKTRYFETTNRLFLSTIAKIIIVVHCNMIFIRFWSIYFSKCIDFTHNTSFYMRVVCNAYVSFWYWDWVIQDWIMSKIF